MKLFSLLLLVFLILATFGFCLSGCTPGPINTPQNAINEMYRAGKFPEVEPQPSTIVHLEKRRDWAKTNWASWIMHEGVLALIVILSIVTHA